MKKDLKEMVSANCYDEIISKIKYVIDNDFVFKLVGPTIIKAIEEGGKDEREEILRNWLDCDSCRVCSKCGSIMEEGYLLCGDYACSDKCRNELYKDWYDYDTDEEAERRYIIDCLDLDVDEVEGMTLEEIHEEYGDDVNSDDYMWTQWY